MMVGSSLSYSDEIKFEKCPVKPAVLQEIHECMKLKIIECIRKAVIVSISIPIILIIQARFQLDYLQDLGLPSNRGAQWGKDPLLVAFNPLQTRGSVRRGNIKSLTLRLPRSELLSIDNRERDRRNFIAFHGSTTPFEITSAQSA